MVSAFPSLTKSLPRFWKSRANGRSGGGAGAVCEAGVVATWAAAAFAAMTTGTIQLKCNTRAGYQRDTPKAKPTAMWCDSVVVCPKPLFAVVIFGLA